MDKRGYIKAIYKPSDFSASRLETCFQAEFSDGKLVISIPKHVDLEDITQHTIGFLERKGGRLYFRPSSEIQDRYELWGRFFRRNPEKNIRLRTDKILLYNGEGRHVGSIKFIES